MHDALTPLNSSSLDVHGHSCNTFFLQFASKALDSPNRECNWMSNISQGMMQPFQNSKIGGENCPNGSIFPSIWISGPIPKGQVKHDNVIVSPYHKHRTRVDSPIKEASQQNLELALTTIRCTRCQNFGRVAFWRTQNHCQWWHCKVQKGSHQFAASWLVEFPVCLLALCGAVKNKFDLEHFFKVMVALSLALCWQLAWTYESIDIIENYSTVHTKGCQNLSRKEKTGMVTDFCCT